MSLTNQIGDLTFWKKGDHIDEETLKVLENIKEIASYMAYHSKEVAESKVFEDTNDRYSQNVLLVNIIDDLGIILTREAWDWIENIEDYNEWMTLVSAMGILKDSKTLLRSLLENKDLTYNYIMGN